MQQQQQQAPQEQPMAYGGIAGIGGRRRYGIGSSIKKRLRKLIPNEVAAVAEKAAPFVAPFNPLIGGLMSGVGGFDRHGSIGKGLKSGLMNYAGGQADRYAGGAGPQLGLKAQGTGSGLGSYFSSPMGTKTGLGRMFSNKVSTAGGSLDPTKPAMLGDTGGNMDFMSGSLPAKEKIVT